ncbi:MAG: hypothetical protein EA378_07000 [Phycisphaerales bacterium]|nr:MAG: hypothetical protein EA378_07000 [Phycisphaerales bacterium]
MGHIATGATLMLSSVFLFAGFAKLAAPASTAEAMASSAWITGTIGEHNLETAAAALGFVEVLLAAWLISGKQALLAAGAALALLALFSVYLAAERLLGTTPGGCGCGLGSDRVAEWFGVHAFIVALWRNVLLGGASLLVLRIYMYCEQPNN